MHLWWLGSGIVLGASALLGLDLLEDEQNEVHNFQEEFWDSLDWRTILAGGLLGYWWFAKSTGKRVRVSKTKKPWSSYAYKAYSASKF